MAGEASFRTSVSLAFEKKRNAEWCKLRKRLHLQLQEDIAKIFSNSLYCDLELRFNSTSIKAHSYFLKVRASKFLSHVCNKSVNVNQDVHSINFNKASSNYVEGFVRNVYSKCTVSKEEDDIVEYLKELNEPHCTTKTESDSYKVVRGVSHDSGLSPESDIFLTPNCSPSDFCSSFCEEHYQVTDSDRTRCTKTSDEITNLHKTNRSYYTIVAVDEVFREEANVNYEKKKSEIDGLLERELAEQDELLKSFKSIKSKEESKIRTTKKLNKPTSLPVSSSLYTKNHKKGNNADLLKTQNKKEKANLSDTLQTSKFSVKNKSNVLSTNRESIPGNSFFEINENILTSSLQKRKNLNESALCCYSCVDNADCSNNYIKSKIHQDVVEEEEFMFSPEGEPCGLKCCQNKDLVDDLLTLTPCSPEMDASGGGPDSGLDTCSTGCIPGGGFSSPREHTVSETSGVDLTEAAIGEDMPHDGEIEMNLQKTCKSSDSSSVSSEVGTWDTSFPAVNAQDAQDQKFKTETVAVSPSKQTENTLNTGIEEETETSQNTTLEIPEIEARAVPENIITDDERKAEGGETKRLGVENIEKINEKPKPATSEQTLKYEPVSDILDESVSNAFYDGNASEIWTDNSSSVNHRRKVSSLGDLQCEYLVDSHIPTSGEKCNDWKIDTSASASNNYFINAATLVDDSELPTSLPPLYIHETSYVVKDHDKQGREGEDLVPPDTATKTPTSSPIETTDKNKPSFMSCENTGSPSKNLPLELNRHSNSNVNLEEKSNEIIHNSLDNPKTENSNDEPSVMRVTFLKMGGTRHEVRLLNGQDLFAEFQKELRMTEHLEPQVGRRVGGGKLKRDSETTATSDEYAPENEVFIDNSISADNDIQEKHETETVNEEHYHAQDNEQEENSNLENHVAPADSPQEKDDKNDDDIEAPRKSSLIRRNTFELDPDEEHIALLRQEYERRQGNLLFQNCIPQFSGHITGSEGFRDSQSLLILGPENEEEVRQSNDQLMSLPSISVSDPLMRVPVMDVDSSLPCQISNTLSNEECENNLYSSYDSECVTMPELSYMEKHCEGAEDEIKEQNMNSKSPEMETMCNVNATDGGNSNMRRSCSSDHSVKSESCGYSRQSSYDIACKPVISGALTCSDLGLEDKRLWDSPKKQQKRTESTPIVSGGVSTVDFSVPLRKVSESPIMRRKNESAPILSGAAPVLVEEKRATSAEFKSQSQASAAAAWVVDMSDCAGSSAKPPIDLRKHRKSDSTSGFSNTSTASDADDSSASASSKRTDSKSSSLGFFVDLKVSPGKESGEIKCKEKKEAVDCRLQKSLESTPINVGYFVGFEDSKSQGREKWDRKSSSFEEKRELRRQTNKNDENKSSGKNSPCGFFIDLTAKGQPSTGPKDVEIKRVSSEDDKDNTQDKKSAIFSMFIDIGDGKQESSGKHGSTESVKSKVASSPLLSSNKKLGFRRASISRDSSEKGSRPNSATFDIDDHLLLEDNGKSTSADGSKAQINKTEGVAANSQPPHFEEIIEHKSNKKQSFFMFIEHESPVIRRKTLPSGLRPNFNRHSWNPETRSAIQNEDTRLTSRRQHKRAHSVSVDRSALCSPGDDHKSSSSSSLAKMQQQGSSHSLCDSALSSEVGMPQMSTSCHARLSSKDHEKFLHHTSSVEEQVEENSRRTTNFKNKHSTHKHDITEIDVNLSLQEASVQALEVSTLENVEELDLKHDTEVYVQDKSLREQDIIHDGSISVEHCSVVKNNIKICKEVMKKVVVDSGIGDSFQGTVSGDVNSSQQKDLEGKSNTGQDVNEKPDGEHDIHDTCNSRKKKESTGNFVRLSDLDKEPSKLNDGMDSSDLLPSFSTTNRMTRSIPETSWIENKLLMTRSVGNSSTSKSLSRLFPHLHTGGSASSSSSMTYNKSPGGQMELDDNDMQISETSDLSSMQSSMGPSGLEGSTEETDASSSYAGRSGPVSRLGEDLLRMFLEEINPDVTVEVGGRRLKAHKCILSSRCQYFAAMLSGGWVESAGNVISLQGFSYNAVHFALCHIYSGTSNIPDTISIVELATLADMLGLEGLKEVIMYTLKVKYCHFFHKPCTMCTVGVLECLPLAAAYGLDEIYRKSLRWITKYFVRIWPTKGFASLPRELIEKCYQQHVVHMSVDNVLETVMCCDKLLATLPNVRWAEPIFGITSQLLETSIKYIANNFSGVLTSENFLSLGRELSWNISRLEDSIMAATDRLPPEQCCQSYSRLHQILSLARLQEPPPEMQWSQNFVDLLVRIQKRVETSLVRQAPRAARCPSWGQMEPELRRKIQEIACLVLVPGDDMHRSRLSSGKRGSSGSSSVYSTGPRSVSSSGLRSLDLRQVRLAMTQQARRAASGGRVSTLKADSKTKVQIKQAPVVQAKKETATTDESSKASNGETSSGRPKTWPMRVLENKSRPAKYRVNSNTSSTGTPEKPTTSAPRRSGKIMISSSDSSRTSSPAMKRSAAGSDGSGRVRASTLTTASGRSAINRSDTPPGRDLRNRRRRDGEVAAISTDSLTESPSNGSSKRSTKEISESNTSRSCISTRPDTPSVRRKARDDATSADSLTSTVNGDKAINRNGMHLNAPNHSGTARPDTPKARKKNVLGKLAAEVTISTDSLATDSSLAGETSTGSKDGKSSGSNKSEGKGGKLVKKTETRSPVSAIWKVSRQSSSSPRDSPTARVRSAVSSSPYTGSPSLRRSLLVASKSDNTSSPNSTKLNTPLKTTGNKSEKLTTKLLGSPSTTSASVSSKKSQTRLQTRCQTISSPAKPLEGIKNGSVKCSSKDGNFQCPINKTGNQKVAISAKKISSPIIDRSKRYSETHTKLPPVLKRENGEEKHPSVGSRSGTFLKDEPTILKKPDIDNVQE